jgi:hypothetical protein
MEGLGTPTFVGKSDGIHSKQIQILRLLNFKKEWFLFLIIQIHLAVVPTIIYSVLIVSIRYVVCIDTDKIEIIRLLLKSKRNSKQVHHAHHL